jgi:hypothetical protein
VTSNQTTNNIEQLFPREKYYGFMWDDAKLKMEKLIESERSASREEAIREAASMAQQMCCGKHPYFDCEDGCHIEEHILTLLENKEGKW